MLVTIEIVSITVLTGSGPDKIYLNTTLTPATWPFNGAPSLQVDCAAGSASKGLADNGLENIPTNTVNV